MYNGWKLRTVYKPIGGSGYRVASEWFRDNEYFDMMDKSKRTQLQLIPGGGTRRWDAMPRDVLVQIFGRIPLFLLVDISCVCRSWRSSVLDTVFPYAQLIPLYALDSMPEYLQGIFLQFLKILLDTRPQTQWHSLMTPTTVQLKGHAIQYIAERSPCLQSLHVRLGGGQLQWFVKAFPCWKNLKSFSCQFFNKEIITVARELSTHSKNILHLGLDGKVGAEEASAVVENLPRVRNLSVKAAITMDAILIFDGLEILETFDLKHSYCVDKDILTRFARKNLDQERGRPAYKRPRAKLWNEEIREKVSGTKRYLRCEENMCPSCSWAYLEE